MEKSFYKWLEEPEDMTGILFWKITYLWQREINEKLKKVNLTHTHFALLSGVAWLSKEEESITQIKLANFTQTNVMVTSKIIRTLEEKGFIERTNEGKDSRAKYLCLTIKGYETLNKASNVVEEVNQEFFKVLGSGKNKFDKDLLDILNSNS